MRSLYIACVLLLSTAVAHGADSQSASLSQPDANKPFLKLFDANNKVIGRLASFQGGDGVFLTVNGATIFVQITQQYDATTQKYSSSRFSWLSFNRIPFGSADCTGRPLVPYDSNGPRPSVAMRQGTDVVVYIGSTADSNTVPTASTLQETYCTTNPDTVSAVQPEASFSITQKYPEPLTIHY